MSTESKHINQTEKIASKTHCLFKRKAYKNIVYDNDSVVRLKITNILLLFEDYFCKSQNELFE